MHLKIITHKEILFDEDINEIYARGIDGEFGVLKDHEPIMSALDIGITKIVQDKGTKLFTTMGGIFQFKDNTATILTDVCEDGCDIDVTRANNAKQRAEARLADNDAKIDAERAQAALARSLARLKAALNK